MEGDFSEVDIGYLSRWAGELGVADQLAAALIDAEVADLTVPVVQYALARLPQAVVESAHR